MRHYAPRHSPRQHGDPPVAEEVKLRHRLTRGVVPVLAAFLMVGGTHAINRLTGAPNSWSALAAGTVAVLLFFALEQIKLLQGPSPRRARSAAVRLFVAAVLAAGVIVGLDASSNRLPCFLGFTNPDLIFCDDFGDARRGWQVGVEPMSGTAQYASDGLRVQANPGYARWVAAPVDVSTSAIRITTRARITRAGAGGWGVWCRGTPDGSSRYEFTVTHDGHAYIRTPERQTEPRLFMDFDASRDNAVQAVCRDVPDGGVELVMHINGIHVLTHVDRSQSILGPGEVGVHAATFGDVQSAPVSVRFTGFRVERSHN
jgi:hypothetical protein